MPPMYLPPRHAPSEEDIRAHITAFTTALPYHEGECSICLERLGTSGVRTRCGHVFHSSCLAAWNAQASSCPYCRQEPYAERQYAVPFHGREPIWLDQEMFDVWKTMTDVEGYQVRERGRWTRPARVEPAPVLPAPVVQQPVVERVIDLVLAELFARAGMYSGDTSVV